MGNRCKYIITFLVILSFLSQSFSWAYGDNKLAKDTELDNDKLIVTSRVLSGLLEDMYRIDKKRRVVSEDDLKLLNVEIKRHNENLKIIYHPSTRSFYLHSLQPKNGPGVVYRLVRKEPRYDPFFGDRSPFHRSELGRFKLAIFTGPLPSSKPPAGSRYGVLSRLVSLVMSFILISMLLTSSPARAQTADPQWLIDLDRVIQLERRLIRGTQFDVSAEYDSLAGGFVSGNADFNQGEWGTGAIAGLGNPIIGIDERGVGGIGTGYWKLSDRVLLDFKGGLLPDYTLDSTFFGLVGVNARMSGARPYLRLGLLHRRLDRAFGNATGLLVDSGVEASWGRFVLDLGASGPLYFRPVAGTISDYRRVVSDLSLLRARLRYNGAFYWVEGSAEAGGTESRLDNRLPSNRSSRYGGEGGLRFDLWQADVALALRGGRVNPSFSDHGEWLADPSLDIRWRDLSLGGGAFFGPFTRPYARVLYRITEGLEASAGYNDMPPLYDPNFYDGPWDPRNLFSFGLRYRAPADSSQSDYPTQGPTGTAMRRMVYGPTEFPEYRVRREVDEAADMYERSLREVVSNAKTFQGVFYVFRTARERFDSLGDETVVALSTWGVFWNAYYKNPNLDLYWMYSEREDIHRDSTTNGYKKWHEYGYSYSDILKRLLGRMYHVEDQRALYLLISEFNQLMNTAVEDGLDNETLAAIQGLYKDYIFWLGKAKPGSSVFVWTYYAASRLFMVLTSNNMYPGIEQLTKLTEAELRIPDSVGINTAIVLPEGKLQELRLGLLDQINSTDLDAQIQGLLTLEVLLNTEGEFAMLPEAIFTRLNEIVLRPVLIPEAEPLVPMEKPYKPEIKRDSEDFKELKASLLALDILVRSGIVPDEQRDALRKLIEKYENLPPELREELRMGVIFLSETGDKNIYKILRIQPKSEKNSNLRVLRKHAGLMPRLLIPMMAGLFLAGCNGTGVGVAAGIGILCLLGFAALPVRPERVEKPVKMYKPTGNKNIDDFLDEVYKDRDKRTILALDTDIGDIRDPAMPLLATLERLSKHGQLGGITFIRAEGVELREKVEKTVGEDKDVNIVLVCKDTNREKFKGLENAFITSIDDSQRSGTTYIPILKILTFSLKIADKAGIDEVRELYKEITDKELTPDLYNGIINGLLSIVLPSSKPMDYEDIRKMYESEKELLLSA